MSLKAVTGAYGPGSTHVVGDGFHVRNLFPSNPLGERVGPFLLLDYAGPTYYPPAERPRGVREHPHRGFETVTLVYQGEVDHRDSAGHAGSIGPGDVQWMTAADGVVHEELHGARFTAEGGTLQMVQLWVNLPARLKRSPPRYQDLRDGAIPRVALPGGAGTLRVVAGRYGDARGPAETATPLELLDARVRAGAEVELALPDGHPGAVVCLEGRVAVGGSELEDAQLAVLAAAGERFEIAAIEDALVLVLAGAPLGEPIVAHGPFVMNTGEELYQAMKDYQSGRMGRLDRG